MGKTTLTAKYCNISHQDQIWKDYVKKEMAMAKLWGREWGFLPEQYQEMRKKAEAAGIITRRSSKSSATSSGSAAKKEEPLKLPPLQAPKQDTSRPFPKVTSREVGWRAGRNLEVFGRWGRPKCSIEHQLKWPHDAVP